MGFLPDPEQYGRGVGCKEGVCVCVCVCVCECWLCSWVESERRG